MWVDGDLVFLANENTNIVNIYRVKERFQDPSQGIVDKVCLDDEIPWCYHDETKVFSILEHLGLTRNTEEGIQELLASVA